MQIYDFSNYKDVVRHWVTRQYKGGRGQFQNMAMHLRMHRTTVSQIFKGEKNLTLEQASDLCDFMGLNSIQSQYFLLLVQKEKAGSVKLKSKLQIYLDRIKKEMELKTLKTQEEIEFDEMSAMKFYSSWHYAAIHLATTINKKSTVSQIAERLGLNISLANESIEFLKSIGLCKEDSKNEIYGIAKATYLPPSSNSVNMPRMNWRMKSLQKMPNLKPSDLMFSAPLSISRKDFEQFRAELISIIEKLYSVTKETHPETIAVFNLDWFEL